MLLLEINYIKFMNSNYYYLKKHIFKNRQKQLNNQKKNSLKFGNLGIISLKTQVFEFVYFRFIKKLIRRRYCKSYTKFYKSKFWMFIKSNFIYSAKSKNARMGAGVGILVRVVSILYKYLSILEFLGFSYLAIKKIIFYLNFKTGLLLYSLKKN